MENRNTSNSTGSTGYMGPPPRHRSAPGAPRREANRVVQGNHPGTSLVVGAKTIAGIGVGLLAVVFGSVALGAVAETVLIPSLLLKLAGGIAGGGVGMAKGLNDVRKDG